MTADTLGGVWVYALELARALGQRGVEVALATMGARLTPEQREQVAQIPTLRICESGYKLEWMENPWEDVRQAGDWLLDLEAQVQPDIIHLNGYAHASLPWRTPVVVVGHSCVLSWWKAVRGEDAPSTWDRYCLEVELGLRSANLVIAPSHAMLDALQEHYGPLENCRVIYNGRAAELLTPLQKEPFVLTAGRLWDEAKNVGALRQVAPEVAWPIYVAGESKHPDGGTANVNRVLHPLGRLSFRELANWFARASIYAFPARYEPFGLSALEAGLAGCALVLGDIPSLREIWDDAALFVPPNDTEALKSALGELIMHRTRREAMAARARRRALEFTPSRMADAYLDAYCSVMDKANAGAKEQVTCVS